MVYQEILENIYKIEIGRNEAENDQLVKEADPNSLWFHLSGAPSPHGILTNIEEPGKYADVDIYRCAELVKSFSKAMGLYRVKIDYIPISHVRRTDKLGLVTLLKAPKIIVV